MFVRLQGHSLNSTTTHPQTKMYSIKPFQLPPSVITYFLVLADSTSTSHRHSAQTAEAVRHNHACYEAPTTNDLCRIKFACDECSNELSHKCLYRCSIESGIPDTDDRSKQRVVATWLMCLFIVIL